MNDGENSYPNFPPDTLGDTSVTKLERLDGMSDRPPAISWGEKFKSWPPERREEFLKKLAESMNHAADVSQQHMRRMSDACFKMDAQLKQAKEALAQKDVLMTQELARADAEKQSLYRELGVVQGELRDSLRQVAALRAKLGRRAEA